MQRRSGRRGGVSGWARRVAIVIATLLTVAVVTTTDPSRAHLAQDRAVAETGSDVRVNDPSLDDGVPPNCRTQTGVDVARSGQMLVAVWADGQQCELLLRRRVDQSTTGISISGYGWSDDGGRTWTDGGTLPPPPGGNLFGDSQVAAGLDGRFHYATLATFFEEPGCCRVGIATSEDGGRTWPRLREVGTDRPGLFHDKPSLAVDRTSSPHKGTLYVAWTEFDSEGNGVYLARSMDHGGTFGLSQKLSTPVVQGGFAPTEYPGQGTQIAIGPDGEVYVVCADGFRLWFTRSLDGGATFASPRPVSNIIPPGETGTCVSDATKLSGGLLGQQSALWRVLRGDIRVFQWPSLAVDTAGSADPTAPDHNPHRGRVYIAIAHDSDNTFTVPISNNGGELVVDYPRDDSNIVVFASADRGDTWMNTAPVLTEIPIVNDDATKTDQFHPQVEVDDHGVVGVSWYDRRRSALPDDAFGPNWILDVYAAVSTDGGETFGPNARVTDMSFPPARTNPHPNGFADCFMGDFNGMTDAAGGGFIVAWGDMREGTDALPDPNVYADHMVVHR